MKTNLQNLYLLLFAIAILFSCKTNTAVYNFEELTADHQRIAIIPFDMKYTGNLPEEISEEQLLVFEEKTSAIFQHSLASQIIKSSVGRKNRLRVTIQATQETNALLKEENITTRMVWKSSPRQLMKILDVDAIVIGDMTYNRIMSEEASQAASVVKNAARVATGGVSDQILPYDMAKSKEIIVNYQLVNSLESSILWTAARNVGGSHYISFSDAIQRANQDIANEFPYRSYAQ